jgi:hypothetical protein
MEKTPRLPKERQRDNAIARREEAARQWMQLRYSSWRFAKEILVLLQNQPSDGDTWAAIIDGRVNKRKLISLLKKLHKIEEDLGSPK